MIILNSISQDAPHVCFWHVTCVFSSLFLKHVFIAEMSGFVFFNRSCRSALMDILRTRSLCGSIPHSPRWPNSQGIPTECSTWSVVSRNDAVIRISHSDGLINLLSMCCNTFCSPRDDDFVFRPCPLMERPLWQEREMKRFVSGTYLARWGRPR